MGAQNGQSCPVVFPANVGRLLSITEADTLFDGGRLELTHCTEKEVIASWADSAIDDLMKVLEA